MSVEAVRLGSSTADALGISREAAQKRLSRALDRLRSIFASRGIESTQDALPKPDKAS